MRPRKINSCTKKWKSFSDTADTELLLCIESFAAVNIIKGIPSFAMTKGV